KPAPKPTVGGIFVFSHKLFVQKIKNHKRKSLHLWLKINLPSLWLVFHYACEVSCRAGTMECSAFLKRCAPKIGSPAPLFSGGFGKKIVKQKNIVLLEMQRTKKTS